MMDLGAHVCTRARPRVRGLPRAPPTAWRASRSASRELPGRKRARAAPRRKRIAMLVVVSQRRGAAREAPAAGHLGRAVVAARGRCDAEPARRCARLGHRGREREPLAPFEHAFTHFTLEVAPWRIDGRARRAASPRERGAIVAAARRARGRGAARAGEEAAAARSAISFCWRRNRCSTARRSGASVSSSSFCFTSFRSGRISARRKLTQLASSKRSGSREALRADAGDHLAQELRALGAARRVGRVGLRRRAARSRPR